MKKKIVIISISIVLLLGLVLLCFNTSQAKTNNKKELKETSHNLDEIYELISTGAYYKSDDTYSEEWIEFNYVLTHFYDYFNKDTKFMIYNKSIKPFENDEELENIG